MTGAVLLDRSTGRPVVDQRLREILRVRDREDIAQLIERSRLMPTVVGAEVTPPLYMDVNNAYSGDELGLPNRDMIGEGIVGAGDLLVSGQAGANSINIAAGSCWVLGDTNPAQQPNYRCYNNAIVNLGISPDPTNPRRVLVGAQVTDQGFAGVGRTWQLQAIHGTPAGSPVLPATPASFLPLCNILVPAAAATSAAYTLTDLRARAFVGGGQALAAIPGGGISTVDKILRGDNTWTAGATLIQTQTLGSVSTVTFSSIPQTYKHLMVRWRATYNGTPQQWLYCSINGVTALNYAYSTLSAVASVANAVANGSAPALVVGGVPSTTGSQGEGVIFLHDYTSAISNRGGFGISYDSLNGVVLAGGFYSGAAAYTSLLLSAATGSFTTGSVFSLYGVGG